MMKLTHTCVHTYTHTHTHTISRQSHTHIHTHTHTKSVGTKVVTCSTFQPTFLHDFGSVPVPTNLFIGTETDPSIQTRIFSLKERPRPMDQFRLSRIAEQGLLMYLSISCSFVHMMYIKHYMKHVKHHFATTYHNQHEIKLAIQLSLSPSQPLFLFLYHKINVHILFI